MEWKEKSRIYKSRDYFVKEGDDIEKKEKIKILIERMKSDELIDSDNPISIIYCFIKQNFRPLSINEIVSILSEANKLENDSQKYNVRNKVMASLKSDIFRKKKYKFDLDMDKTVNYLASFLESRPPSNLNNSSSDSKKSDLTLEKNNIRVSPVFKFPECQNETIYFPPYDNQQKSSCSNIDDNSFTFGEQSQIKINKINKKDEEETLIKLNETQIKKLNKKNFGDDEFKELENKAIEKYIPEFELIFDRNYYLSNLEQEMKELFKSHENNNVDKPYFSELENDLNNIYSLLKDYGLKIKQFTENSSLFNEQKRELLILRDVIQDQLKLIKIILKTNFIPEESISSEKGIFKLYVETFKNIFVNFQENYGKSKSNEKEINEIIIKIRRNLKRICANFPEEATKELENLKQIVKNIEVSESIPIKVNINETVKLFYYYINEFENYFLEIESNK